MGNGVVEPLNNEQCDDGNTMNGDGCSATGQIEAWCEDADYAQTNAAGEVNVNDVISNKKIELINLVNNVKNAANYQQFKNGLIPAGWQCPPPGLQPGLFCANEIEIGVSSAFYPPRAECEGGEVLGSINVSISGLSQSDMLNNALRNASLIVEELISNAICPEICDRKIGFGIEKVENITLGANFVFNYRVSCLQVENNSIQGNLWNEDSKVQGFKSCNEI